MALALLMALQTAAAPVPVKAVDFDLAKHLPSPERQSGCGDAGASEIIVCGRRAVPGLSTEEMEELERRYREKPVRAEMGIAPNASVRVYGDSVSVGDNGLVNKRAMVGVKIGF